MLELQNVKKAFNGNEILKGISLNVEDGEIISILGPSGSGKTTVAKVLQHELGHNVMVVSQDVVRREMLRVKDGAGTKALPLLSELLMYGKNNCETVILEGIL